MCASAIEQRLLCWRSSLVTCRYPLD
uniref:Uncharacterized protein n=1 Tax=Arundo donax TaxID=35708 RepID=A0A0A9HPH6_ARUDO